MIGGSRNAYLDGCYTLGDYQGPLKKALIQLKFAGNPVRETSFAFCSAGFPGGKGWKNRIYVCPCPCLKKGRPKEAATRRI